MKTNVPADRNRIGAILGTISETTFEENKILVSAIVHRKSAGETHPGPGFFELATQLGLKVEDEKQFLAREMNKVWNHYAK